jgi:hypothetical protein
MMAGTSSLAQTAMELENTNSIRQNTRGGEMSNSCKHGWTPICPECSFDRVVALETLIIKLKRGRCWCERSIGNPMVTEHTEACIEATELIGPDAQVDI